MIKFLLLRMPHNSQRKLDIDKNETLKTYLDLLVLDHLDQNDYNNFFKN